MAATIAGALAGPGGGPLISPPLEIGGAITALAGAAFTGWRRSLGLGAASLVLTYRHPLALAMACGGMSILVLWPFLRHSLPVLTLPLSDRFLHTHVVGPTGSGKSSSVLMPMLAHDLSNDHGVILIEPKGDLSRAAYQQALASRRTVVFFDPDRPDCPRYNPLSGPGAVAAEGLAWALNQVSEAGHPFYAVTSRVQLIYAVLAVKDVLGADADLTSVVDFLRREGFRRDILAQLHDERALAYFRDQVGQLSARTAQEQRQGLLNRLELLLLNPSIRRAIVGPPDFDWDTVLQYGWVVIAPLSLARLGESARILGTLLWHGLAMAVYRRPLHQHTPPAFLYLDEFHQYVTPDLSDFLALARGYRTGLVLAHQDLGQLSPTLSAAILSNARQRILLGGLSAQDTEVFSRQAAPYLLPADLRTLRRGRAIVQTTRGGHLRRPTVVRLPYHSLEES